jgi:lysozyme
MKTIPAGISLIKHFEGLSLVPYYDPVGYPTIGYGHRLSSERWADLSRWAPVTKTEAKILFNYDVLQAEYAVTNLIWVFLSRRQFSALVSLAFNIGYRHLSESTLRRRLNDGALEAAPEQFRRWVWAGGERRDGLVQRREFEIELGKPWIAFCAACGKEA